MREQRAGDRGQRRQGLRAVQQIYLLLFEDGVALAKTVGQDFILQADLQSALPRWTTENLRARRPVQRSLDCFRYTTMRSNSLSSRTRRS
ncbi:hypothetical protein SBA4_1650012 [Candidatus Sulfopaludibacter sp. SbA4]|nr:hypothetical protein SBA4_1650012 [Candidatus Sulfopaludibacter sp. SbA4]